MKVYLLRHGETYLNKQGGHFQGQIDTPEADLDEAGREQARKTRVEFARRGFHFDLVYSSPQKRAVETAELATGCRREQMILDDRLKEQAFGPFEGQPWEKMNPATFHALMQDPMHYYPGPGMESVLHLIQRSGGFLDELGRKLQAPSSELRESSMKKKPADTEERILVSTHGGVVRGMLQHLHIGSLEHFWDIPVGNCAWYELTWENGGFRLTDKNERQ